MGLAVVGLAVCLSPACPDPCVLSGKACNQSDDCQAPEVCVLGRPFAPSCPVVGGLCQDVECGSDADCPEGECCDVAGGNQCTTDAFECRVPECALDGDCGDEERCVLGACRGACRQDADCPGSQRCVGEHCGADVGAPCDPSSTGDWVVNVRSCYFGECVRIDASRNPVEPYCTGACGPEEQKGCEPPFVCDEQISRCVLP